jgi:putative ABC transport system substrate-binding protein
MGADEPLRLAALRLPDDQNTGDARSGTLMGLVSSLAHPGGTTIGISILATELDGKRQLLLMELVAGARRTAALAEPGVIAPEQLRALEDAARPQGIELSIHRAAKPEEIVPAIDAAQTAGTQALNVLATPLFDANQRLIIERTGTLKFPAIYQWREIAEAGGLAAYGPRQTEVARQRARHQLEFIRLSTGRSPGLAPWKILTS